MSVENSILKEVFKGITFSSDEIEAENSQPKFEILHFRKNDIILNINDMVYDQYYVSKGCLRTYFVDNLGKEHTLQFAIKDWWISDYTAFFSSTKAIMNIECLQDCTLYRISKIDMDLLLKEKVALETFFRKKMENSFAAFQKRILSNLSQSAKEKYISFLETYPEIEKNIKNYHIASYLGITTESLSRIRKEIAQK